MFLFVWFGLSQLVLLTYAQNATVKCGRNQLLDPCKNPCQPTCREPKPPVCNFLVCQPGCVCRKGLLWNEDINECVPPERCPKVCERNAEWTECGAACSLTCQNRDNPPVCPAVCKRGCVCKKGFIFDNNIGKCIPEDSCLNTDTTYN